MRSTFLEQTSQQIKSVINQHLDEMRSYINLAEPGTIQIPEALVGALERLSLLCNSSCETATETQYQEAARCLAQAAYFLEVMHQPKNPAFEQTPMGMILEKAYMWTESFYTTKQQTSISHVWTLIDPVRPDTLTKVEAGIYEAGWWKPVPMMDIEILYRTEGITILGKAFEPEDMVEGMAVRFSITE